MQAVPEEHQRTGADWRVFIEIAAVLRIPAEKRKPKQKEMLFGHFKSVSSELTLGE